MYNILVMTFNHHVTTFGQLRSSQPAVSPKVVFKPKSLVFKPCSSWLLACLPESLDLRGARGRWLAGIRTPAPARLPCKSMKAALAADLIMA